MAWISMGKPASAARSAVMAMASTSVMTAPRRGVVPAGPDSSGSRSQAVPEPERAVGEDLDAPDAQSLGTEARTQAELCGVLEIVGEQVVPDAQRQAPLEVELLPASKGSASVHVLQGSDAAAARLAHGSCEHLHGQVVGGQCAPNLEGCGLAQDAREVLVGIELDNSRGAGGNGVPGAEVGDGNAEMVECQVIGEQRVPILRHEGERATTRQLR